MTVFIVNTSSPNNNSYFSEKTDSFLSKIFRNVYLISKNSCPTLIKTYP
ncbi:hypothetical protein LEP1GSC062_1143 [Leptospira alexanderi serovar Manhao 3 str. L 60]|uniref:Uncharacterized protein n=1 Tax=Leptospira alexanderi serovar Manhao 3 str. L 60 TaxID=1049759 RepID=V6I7W6_9LEPT|nr:hypothetical protein LEP1GSC062_1143 [Leptospira alexanderi serovar Manhao 3 str. L 60]